jgi:hypothetical protein
MCGLNSKCGSYKTSTRTQIQHKINIITQKRRTEDKANKPKAAHMTKGTKQQYKLITGTKAPYPGHIDRLIRELYKLLVA